MDEKIYSLDINELTSLCDKDKMQSLEALEDGKVIYLPVHSYRSSINNPSVIFSDQMLDGKHKNVSYHFINKQLGGCKQNQHTDLLKIFMHEFAQYARTLVDSLFPGYTEDLIWGRTSYRPAEIKGRASSKRKDDTRLHVDAFPASPVQGKRILRVFCNVNPNGLSRVWHLGEPFEHVFKRFLPRIPPYRQGLAQLMYLLKMTKTLRSAYDHYQLHLHDQMKLDDRYQAEVLKHRFDFPAQSTWIVFTDQVSHAALSGQFLLEQTFYLPVTAQKNPYTAPLYYWHKNDSEMNCLA